MDRCAGFSIGAHVGMGGSTTDCTLDFVFSTIIFLVCRLIFQIPKIVSFPLITAFIRIGKYGPKPFTTLVLSVFCNVVDLVVLQWPSG
jgi:hypothetical protein